MGSRKRPVNSAVWAKRAKDAGIDLSDVLFQNKKGMYEALDEIGLPRPKTLFYPAAECDKHRREIKEFIEKYGPVFSRLNPLDASDVRPYKMFIKSLQEFLDFVSNSKVNLAKYEVHIVENGNVGYAGSIVSDKRLVGELSRGSQIDLFQGWVTPMTAMFDELRRRFVFMNDEGYGPEEKEILLKAIRMIKDHKGYFEFFVLDSGKILFKNFQTRGGFARI